MSALPGGAPCPASGEAPRSRRRLFLLLALFAASGAAALVVEATWMRWLRALLGATAPAASATTAAFFAGSALGALWGARRVSGLRDAAAALSVYARLELWAAGGAVLAPGILHLGGWLLEAAYAVLVDAPGWRTAARFAIAFAATAPAATAFGATLPAMGAATLRSPRSLGATGSLLVAVNTLGAACGAAAAAWWLPPWLGVRGTYAVGVGLSLGAATGAVWLARVGARAEPAGMQTPPGAPGRSGAAAPPLDLLGLSALSGFVALAGQVLLVQALAQVMDQSVGAFGAVLVSVLLCLAAGAFAVAALRARAWATGRGILGWAWVGAALGFTAFPAALHAATDGFAFIGARAGGLAYWGSVLATSLACAGPALLAAACVWPSLLAVAGDEADGAAEGGGAAGGRLGWLAAANTLGAIAGALAAPYLLMPAFGLWGAFLGLAACCAAAALAAAGSSRGARAVALAVGAAGVLGLARPQSLPVAALAPGERLVEGRTTPAGVVAVVERRGERLIRIDNHYALGGTGELRHEARQGHLPLVLHGDPRRVAFVGTATGITAGAAVDHDPERITLVEIVPGVARAAERFFADANRGVYGNARSRVVLDDARNYLRLTDERFDVVVADLFVPWRAGTGALYTREHFAAVRERLRPGGLFCQWLPLYQLSRDELQIVAATFGDVFPGAAVFRGDFFGRFPIVALVGWADRPAPAERVAEAARRLARSGVEDRWVTDPLGVWALYVGAVPPDPDGRVPRNLEDRPRIEFMAARDHEGGRRGRPDPIVGLAWSQEAADWQRAVPPSDAPYPDLPPDARRAREGGAVLQLAGGLYAAGREAEAARALAAAAERLPARLLADAVPDPSAAELWFDGPPAPGARPAP